MTLLTGRNGTGKSLVLEALTAAWSGNINLPEFVGPYGHTLVIELAISLEPHEYDALDAWNAGHDWPVADRKSEHALIAMATNHEESGFYDPDRDNVMRALQNPLFARSHPFASIDFLSARRQVSINTTTSVDLGLLDKSSSADERRSMYEQEIRWKSAMQMPDVGSYLTSLDYRDFITKRSGGEGEDEYGRLTRIFEEATGKTITLPEFDPVTAESSIRVRLPSGNTHELSDLSNGEREMLGMLYFVSQLSSQGGVLLLDEPEKHMHPTLQLAVLNAIRLVTKRGQVLVVTHSPALIAASPSRNVLTVEPAWSANDNQIRTIAEDEQSEVLASLGLSMRDLVQSDFLLIVEGQDDERRLRILFPEELAAAKVSIAGSRNSVLEMAKSLRRLDLQVPFLGLVDRDFATEQEVTALMAKGDIFVWDMRMLENVLLSAELLQRVIGPTTGEKANFEAKLGGIIDALKDDAVEQFVNAAITRRLPSEELTEPTGRGDRIQAYLINQKDLWEFRIKVYDETRTEVTQKISETWGNDCHRYVDGKRVFAEIQRRWPIFKNRSTLLDMVMLGAHDQPNLMPAAAGRFKAKLKALRTPKVAKPGDSAPTKDFTTRDQNVSERFRMVEEPSPRLNLAPPEFGC